MHQNVARCRDGDVSRVSLKYDAAECSPGLLSMEWYPSLTVPGCCRMFTLIGEHGVVPSLFLEFFYQLVSHAGTCVLQRHMAPSLYLFLFLWKTFLLPLFLCFFWSASCTLAHACSLALKARAEAVLTTIYAVYVL